MSIGKVVRHFESIGKVPVDLREVLALVRSLCPDEIIKVRGVDVDPDRLKGNCYRYKIPPPAGSAMMSTKVSYIVYSTRMSPDEQRLVFAKELVHIANPDPIVTSTMDQVLHLAEKVIKPLVLKPGQTTPNDIAVFLDQLAKWKALAILFPFGLREELLAKKPEADWDCAIIGREIEVPAVYVSVVLSPLWVTLREDIIAFG